MLGVSTAGAAEIVLLHGEGAWPAEDEQIRQAGDLYGLSVHVQNVNSSASVQSALELIRQADTLAVLISGDALARLDRTQVAAALRRTGNKKIPVLVFGIEANPGDRKYEDALGAWSGGTLRAERSPVEGFRPDGLQVGHVPDVMQVLAGWQLPAVAAPLCDLQWESSSEIQIRPVLEARNAAHSSPVLARLEAADMETFFAPRTQIFDSSWMGTPLGLPKAFSSMAQFIVFVRYAAGEYGWHLNGRYANFTIDDPWLREPYGNLNYRGLLDEMERHNFHTTIAFIPWNFDRSNPQVVELFRQHPERYSISIHGNDHKHQEFAEYSKVPLQAQVDHLKQAVARMEKFQALTGIPYDRFMVFPHGVAPEATFVAMKNYDYLGTANSLDVPMDAAFPKDPAFLLRPFTLKYAQFLSLFRYSAEEGQIPRVDLAVQSFLGNPLLFYGHEPMFARGTGVFNEFADFVNQLQPDTKWAGLGEIARHMYLLRKRNDGEFDVRMLSNEMQLENPSGAPIVFNVERQESSPLPSFTLTVDGAPSQSQVAGNLVRFRVVVPAGQSARAKIVYANDLDLATQSVSKSNLYAAALRYVSDFRDLYLSRYSWGRTVTSKYYGSGWNSRELEVERDWWVFPTLLALLLGSVRYLRRRSGRSARKDTPVKDVSLHS